MPIWQSIGKKAKEIKIQSLMTESSKRRFFAKSRKPQKLPNFEKGMVIKVIPEIEKKNRALVAMSGGVDSSVAAYLTKEAGYDAIGVTMKLYANEEIGLSKEKTCCSLDDVEDARSVAYKIGIPYYVFQFEEDFEKEVIRRFIDTYKAGGTPNPCIDCNRYIKFKRLYRRAEELSRDTLVTGHYARVEKDSNNRFLLKKGIDFSKDQSYVLAFLTTEQLAHTYLPLGSYHKEEVREIAAENGFLNARKPDSQDICFVPDGKYADFIDRYTGIPDEKGNFIDVNGHILGNHKGFCRYTIGQRKHLGIPLSSPLTVCKKDPKDHSILLAPEEFVYSSSLLCHDLNWIACDRPSFPISCTAKIRYRAPEAPAVLTEEEDGKIRVTFQSPQRAVTPGQTAVFYDGDTVIGAGEIL